jgi:hypothetical protein
MSWEKLDIHVENLAPGLATVWALSLLWQPPAIYSVASKVVLGIPLLGAAYITGVLVNVLCRVLLDPPSEYLTRVYVFKVFSRAKLRDLVGASRQDVNNAYNYYCEKAVREAKETAKEVAKRRQTGRLLRSALPLLLVQLHLSISWQIPLWCSIALMAAEYLLLLLLYGYAEVTILHEAYHAVPEEERSMSVIKRILENKRLEGAKAEPAPAGFVG